jgi:hypothetical protein
MHMIFEHENITKKEIIDHINELEDGYAAALKDGESLHTLHQIWRHIQQLNHELRNENKER